MIALPFPAALIARATVLGSLADNRARALLAVAGIALGVALGVAVHVINQSAVNEFSLAVASVSGEADLTVLGPRAGFPEALYARIAQLPDVAAASPALELDARLAGSRDAIKVLGLEVFRALQVQPSLLGAQDLGSVLEMLASDAVALSPAAAQWLALNVGGKLRLQAALSTVELRVVGLLPAGSYRQRIAVMDIAGAQWKLQRLGVINRIDVRARPGADLARLTKEISLLLPAGVLVAKPDAEAQQGANLSRSYRTNLDMLALVALFTGAFLVFSMQALVVLKRRGELALLRVLGMTRSALMKLLLAEAALIGALGAAIGVALGYAVAIEALKHLGADLGAGYFEGIVAIPRADPIMLSGFFASGVAVALLGAWLPAWEAACSAPAMALKSGDQESVLAKLRNRWPGALLIAVGALLTQALAINAVPVAGYLAIACILCGTIVLLPALVATVFGSMHEPRSAIACIALQQLRGAPGHATISLAAILVSFSLMVSMLIMIASFRQSLDDWLSTILPADLYLRAGFSGQAGFFAEDDQKRIAHLPGVARADFLRAQSMLLSADKPAVMLLARALGPGQPQAVPLVSARVTPGPGEPPPVFVSEAVRDLYGVEPGSRIELPITGKPFVFTVAGIWRDYARQTGAVLIERKLYVELSGDRLANDIWLWLAPGYTRAQIATGLRELMPEANFEIREPAQIRAASLAIFDRTFAITYALQAAAVLIGLFGISVSFGAQVLTRRREFGMLRHIGMTRGEIGAMLSLEGAALGSIGALCGLALGWVISLVLVHVVNRQSFHWSMDMHVPWLPLAAVAAILIAAASLTAVWSGRRAMSADMVKAVKEDW